MEKAKYLSYGLKKLSLTISRAKFSLYFLCLVLLSFTLVITLPTVAIQQTPITTIVENFTDPVQLFNQGKSLYRAGRYAEAVQSWQEAAKAYQTQGDRLKQALTLSYLSLAEQELGQWQAAETAINTSLNLLEDQPQASAVLAHALNTQASLQLAMGKAEAAFQTWQQAEAAYASVGDETGVLGTQINQTQALQTLGLYRRSQQILKEIQEKLENQPDSALKVTGLHNLGSVLQVIGSLEKSQQILSQSLAIAQKLNLNLETSTILLSLGNTSKARGQIPEALNFYQQAATTATSPLTQLEAQINQFSLLIETQQWQEAGQLIPQIKLRLSQLEASRDKIYAQVNLAKSLITYAENQHDQGQKLETAQILAQAVQEAQNLQDSRAESYALGILGHLYEQNQQWQEAKRLTLQALQIAQSINASSIIYQWQWQLGRILKAQGDLPGAIAAESEAVNTLNSLRSDLVAINPDVQFSFRESVEPVYRQLVQLLLTPVSQESAKQVTPGTAKSVTSRVIISQENLKKAREVIESLQLAELDNFFRESCLDAQPKQIDQIDPQAAIIYPIILPDRLAVILSIPGQPLDYYQTNLSQAAIENNLEELLQSLNPAFSKRIRLSLSQTVYNWLIKPAETELTSHSVETLVFVLDGFLRNIPMAALYDGQQYLVEKYNLALTPGLQLLKPQSLAKGQIKAFMGGISEENQGFSALPGVKIELEQIGAQIPSAQLLNQQFTNENFKTEIEEASFPIIHLATHGQFSSDPEQTFVMTWDDRVKVKEFENLLRTRETINNNPIELLVLSACQTATGDKQAALGLAGMAVRSGARSTIATLWSVKDESTTLLMTHFYEEFSQNSANKAKALREAQLFLLKSPHFSHPFYWASFVLVGNWL